MENCLGGEEQDSADCRYTKPFIVLFYLLPSAFLMGSNRRGELREPGLGWGFTHPRGNSQMGKAPGAETEKLHVQAFSHLQPRSFILLKTVTLMWFSRRCTKLSCISQRFALMVGDKMNFPATGGDRTGIPKSQARTRAAVCGTGVAPFAQAQAGRQTEAPNVKLGGTKINQPCLSGAHGLSCSFCLGVLCTELSVPRASDTSRLP